MLNKLQQFRGQSFDVDYIICAFGDTGDVPVVISDSHNGYYDYALYLDEPDSECYCFKIDSNGVITDVF